MNTIYTCPMHPDIKQPHPGRCSKCGMKLIPASEVGQASSPQSEDSYTPLVVIIGLISLVTLTLGIQSWLAGAWQLADSMRVFMAGFFLVFAGFKLIDLPGFVEGYQTYDLLAKRVPAYGYVYPFLELGLGLLYAVGILATFTNLATLILLGFSGIGVAIKVAKKEKFRCACLGTFLKVPLTKVTLIEDFGMAIMAGIMLLLG